MTASSMAFTQDSLRLVPVRAWQLSRLIDEVRSGRICDSVLMSQTVTLKVADSLINNLEGQKLNLSRQVEMWKYQAENWESAYNKSVNLHKQERRISRGQGRKEGFFCGILLLTLVLAFTNG